MAMKWKFWEKSQPSSPSAQDAEKKEDAAPDNPDNNDTPEGKAPDGDAPKGKVTHAFLDTQIDQEIAATLAKIQPVVAEIQQVSGDIAKVQSWYSDPQNLTDLVLKYAKMTTRPTRKDVLYGDVLTEGSTPDEGVGLEFAARLNKFVQENRPEAGFLTRMKKSSIDAKQTFLTDLRAQAQSVVLDVESRREKALEELLAEKQTGLDKIHRLYDFYIGIEAALNSGDIDSMLDISHGHLDSAVNRILNVDLSEMHDFKEAGILIRHIGVYDKLVEAAAHAPTPQAGLDIIGKVTAQAKNEMEVLSFIEDAIKATKSGDLDFAYTQYMLASVGDFIPAGGKFINARQVVDAHYDESGNAIKWRLPGGAYGIVTMTTATKNKSEADAILRIVAGRPEFLDTGMKGSGFNASYIVEAEQGYYNPASHSGPGRVKDELRESGDYKTMAFSQTAEMAQVLRAVIDKNGITEFDPGEHVDFDSFIEEIQKRKLLEKHDGLPLIDPDQFQFVRYNYDLGALEWSVAGTGKGFEWHHYEVGQPQAKAFIDNLLKRTQFVTCPDGWVVNLDQVQAVTYNDVPEETLESFAQEKLDAGAEEVVIAPTKALCIHTASGENGFSEWFDMNVGEAEALSFVKQCAARKNFVKIDEKLALNTGQMYQAYVTFIEEEIEGEDGNVTTGELKPTLVFALYGRENEYVELQTDITQARYGSVIDDLAAAIPGAFTVTSPDGTSTFVVNPAHIARVAPLEDGGVDIEYAGAAHGVASWSLPLEDGERKQLHDQLAANTQMQALPDGSVVSRRHTLYVTPRDNGGLAWVIQSGLRGEHKFDVAMNAEDTKAVIESLRSYGRERLADDLLQDKRRDAKLASKARTPTVTPE